MVQAKELLKPVLQIIKSLSTLRTIKKETELSNEFWRLKELNAQPKVVFYIKRRCPPTKRKGPCQLCLNEKLIILEHKENNLLNKRNELISKCRHKNKFKLANHKT